MVPDERKENVKLFTVESINHGQRIDNFLLSRLKGLPKSRLYRALRSGEIRVNKKRIKPDYRLQENDLIRIPPLRVAERPENSIQPAASLLDELKNSIIYEDKAIIIINKPSGIASHGGSGIQYGVIEAFRLMNPKLKYLELAHRLDRDTSGCLVLAKKPSILKELQAAFLGARVDKSYLAIVAGVWEGKEKVVKAALLKNQLKSGERIVTVNEKGKEALTIFRPLKKFANATLIEAKPMTGRTHQIRVHAAYIKHPIIGDEKYGDANVNKEMRAKGYKRLFLHSAAISFNLSNDVDFISVCAVLDKQFSSLRNYLIETK